VRVRDALTGGDFTVAWRAGVDSALAVATPQPGAPVLFLIPQPRAVLAGTMHLPRPPGLARREVVCDHGATGGAAGFFTISGVKFTTTRDVARQVLATTGLAGIRDGDAESLQLPPAPRTDVLTDSSRFLNSSQASRAAVLQRVVTEEAVQCTEELVPRRFNRGVTDSDAGRIEAALDGSLACRLDAGVSSESRP
jgi:glycerol-3-phosphate dehydrogenase